MALAREASGAAAENPMSQVDGGAADPAPETLSPVERVLHLFTEVRPGEGQTALCLFAGVFLLLCAYYLIKPLREGWISISAVGHLSKMEVKAYSSFGQTVLLLLAMGLYSPLVDRWRRIDLLSRVTAICMVTIVVFWFLQPDFFIANIPATGVIFYLWVGMFGVFVVAQFWAFVADLYPDRQGRRLIPLVAIGATSGAAAGSWFTETLVASKIVPIEELLLVALIPLAASMWLARRAESLGPLGRGSSAGAAPPRAEPAASRRGAMSLIKRSRLLLAVAFATLLLNWINTNGENLLFRVLQELLADEARAQGIDTPSALLAFTRAETAAFYASLYFWVNVSALVLQCFVASRLLKYGGFGVMLLFAPTVALMTYSAMALVPILAVVKAMKVVDNANDYSINNTARNVLWLPVAPITKRKAKPAIDSFFARAGDGFSALTVLIGVQILALGTNALFAFTVSLVVVWLSLAVVVVREHAKLVASKGEPPEGGVAGVHTASVAQPATAGGHA